MAHPAGAEVQHFFHAPTGTLSYAVSDPETGTAAVVDPVVGFSNVSGHSDPQPVLDVVDYLRDRNLTLRWILETHAHADHVSGAQLLKSRLGGEVGIGIGIRSVQETFGRVFNLKAPFAADGRQFDRLFQDGDTFAIGALGCRVISTPGHTSDSVTYLVGNIAFVGDTLFMPDIGTARCDFPGGDAGTLYDSIQAIFALGRETLLYMCHDYPTDRPVRASVAVGEQQESNVHLRDGATREAFVRLRRERDASLSLPALILPALQINIRAGHFPEPEDNGTSYIKIPLDAF